MQPSRQQPHKPNSVLVVSTLGGSPHSAYRIARIMQNTSANFSLCIPRICKSAGTLIALGASVSELGPLDIQLRKRDEIDQIRSGMVARTALRGLAEETFAVYERVMLGITVGSDQTVSFEVSSRIAAEITAGVMAPIYAQIEPESLGNDLRDLNIATAYGDRLAEFGTNVKPGSVRRLVEDYPAHTFIVDKAEARTLFRKVSDLSDEVSGLIRELGEIAYSPQDPHIVKRLDRIIEEESENEKSDEASDQETGEANGDAGQASSAVDNGC